MKAHNANSVTNSNESAVIPSHIQERLNETYASLKNIPQEKCTARKRPARIKRKTVALIAAAACLTFGGAAFAASNLLQIGTGQTNFFDSQQHLSVYESMKTGASKLTTQVGQQANIDDMLVTLDEITCDRNVANLYLTLHRDNGFNLEENSHYEGSQESDWARLQDILPLLNYSILNSDGKVYSGQMIPLDAYMQNGDVRVLMRITPECTLTDIAIFKIQDWRNSFHAREGIFESTPAFFEVSIDLKNVEPPKEMGAQTVTFKDIDGNTHDINISRFTSSEMGTVLAYSYSPVKFYDTYGNEVINNDFNPKLFLYEDNLGNVLFPVKGGIDGSRPAYGKDIIEFAGCSPEATSVKITPIENTRETRLKEIEETGKSLYEDYNFNVNQIGIEIPENELGGWILKEWKVANNTVTLRLRPYGWHSLQYSVDFSPTGKIPVLWESWTNNDTGENGVGGHMAVEYERYDYESGDLLYITSYYAASDELLLNLQEYKTRRSIDGMYARNDDAAVTLKFNDFAA